MSRGPAGILGAMLLVLACESAGKRELVIQFGAGGNSAGDSAMGGGSSEPACEGESCTEGEGGGACADCEPECAVQADCGDEYCSADRSCVSCLESSHCLDEDKPACGPSGEWVECLSRADCQGERAECDTAEFECVECLTDDHCEGGTCDLKEHECQEQ